MTPPAPAGTSFAVIAGGAWDDVRVRTALQPGASSNGLMGFVWRYASPGSHVRLAIDFTGNTVSAVRRTGGVDHSIWSGALPAAGASPIRNAASKCSSHRSSYPSSKCPPNKSKPRCRGTRPC